MIEMKMSREPGTNNITVQCRIDGSTDALLDELAAGMADVIVSIADDLPAQDELHESLARVMASKMIDMVRSRLDLRSQAQDGPAEA